MAAQISQDYKGEVPVLICVLNGSFLFFTDLVRELTIDCEVDFVKISSYGDALKSSGKIDVLKNVDCPLEGRHVLIVEDIIDTGLSVHFLRRWIKKLNPASMRFVSLLVKEGTAIVDYECEYRGFTIGKEFVIGYGLDYKQLFRNLPEIYIMPEALLDAMNK
ncbi:MAG: hypoxanthine phosphoribosyltransferase [Deferribacteres bacterium]|nr:hypoxanthine phosphoribosyltransferase [candidate division KSB1 bacterium]MCB9503922.1 hypoxanthine phosphoribosyltransferase [Deferribacteres bacterium]